MEFVNQQTYYRGQTSTMLFQSIIDLDVTDLLAKIPNAQEA